MKKVLFSLFLMVLAIGFVNSNLYAAAFVNTYTEDEADFVFNFETNKTEVAVGDEVTFTLKFDKTPTDGMSSCNFRVIYDSTQLEFLSAETTDFAKNFSIGFEIDDTDFSQEFENARQVVWAGAGFNGIPIKYTGLIATMNFKVKDTSVEKPTIYMKEDSLSAGLVDYDPETESYKTSVTHSKIYLKSNVDNLHISHNATDFKKGDINRDGKVTVMDVRYGLKALTKGTITSLETQIGDVNGDNKFSVMDARKILRYIVGKIPSLD